jgi:hypothetical protein
MACAKFNLYNKINILKYFKKITILEFFHILGNSTNIWQRVNTNSRLTKSGHTIADAHYGPVASDPD